MQDVQPEALPVLEEALSHSPFGNMVMVGTASDEGSEFSRLWQQSDMKEWDSESGAWIPQKPENRFYSGYHIDQRMAPWIKSLPPTHPNRPVVQAPGNARRSCLADKCTWQAFPS